MADFKNISEENSTSHTFYVGLVQWDSFKVCYLIFHIILTFIGPALLYSIVWYERFSSDIRYRTLMNQLLSHICIFSIVDCFSNRILYVSIICFGPYSTLACEFLSFMGRYFYLIRIMGLFIRQLFRYFYIFQWKYFVTLNNDFFAIYFTLCNLILSFLFIFTTHELGYHNSDLDYHICTGKTPTDNIYSTFLQMSRFIKSNDPPPTYRKMIAKDPVNVLTLFVFIMLVLICVQTWVYSKKHYLINIWILLTRIGKSPNQVSNTTSNNSKEDTKNVILGASGTLALSVLIILIYIPASISRFIAHIDPDRINYGSGKLLNYASRFSIPILHYCILPIITIGSNSKMRKTLMREFKDFLQGL